MVALTVDVQIACDDDGIPAESDIRAWVDAAVQQSGRTIVSNAEIAVRIVAADEIQSLNHCYRKQDATTNVLSFPAGTIEGLPGDASLSLGDVVVCASVVSTEASEQGKQLADHWAHMLIHGTLHLLGFDHETEAEAAEMESLETKVLASQSVTDPYGAS